MIPKVIHFCWFGGSDIPDDILSYIATWRKQLPDYQIKKWDETNFPYECWDYTKEAYMTKKYAFVSDVCRLYALYHEGGIYLDTDVEVIKSFDPFLNNKSFIGLEPLDYVGTAVIGAECGCQWIKEALALYKNEKFILKNGNLNIWPNVQRLTKFLKIIPDKIVTPIIFPIDYFCANDWQTHEIKKTINTVCIHHYGSSWTDNDNSNATNDSTIVRLKSRLRNILNKLSKS